MARSVLWIWCKGRISEWWARACQRTTAPTLVCWWLHSRGCHRKDFWQCPRTQAVSWKSWTERCHGESCATLICRWSGIVLLRIVLYLCVLWSITLVQSNIRGLYSELMTYFYCHRALLLFILILTGLPLQDSRRWTDQGYYSGIADYCRLGNSSVSVQIGWRDAGSCGR